MCFGGNGGEGMEGGQEVIYVPISQEYLSQMYQEPTGQIQGQGQQFNPYTMLGGMTPQAQGQGGGANAMLGSGKGGGGDFSSSGNLGTTSMLPGASQLLRQQQSPQYTWS